jgi:stage V sporulation protein SpoVS
MSEVIEVTDPALLLVSGEKERDKEYVKKLSNAVLQVLSKHGVARMRCVGAAALNNATKAYIIANGESQKKGKKLISEESFTIVDFDGNKKTGILKEIKEVTIEV